jgi:hypothetical protein
LPDFCNVILKIALPFAKPLIMKSLFFLLGFILFTSFYAHSQQISPADLIGAWDQSGVDKHVPSMIFVDSSRVEFSYKGHTGTSKKYYYIINNATTPIILTIDYKANHRKHRNEYLIQIIDKDTMKLQVLHTKDARDHFDETNPDRIYTIVRRK